LNTNDISRLENEYGFDAATSLLQH